jgi:hypothetical protein
MIPFTNRTDSNNLTENFHIYVTDVTYTVSADVLVFTHNYGNGKRFIPIEITAIPIYNPLSRVFTLSFGSNLDASNNYTDYSAAITNSTLNQVYNRTVLGTGANKKSIAYGAGFYSTISYSATQSEVTVRIIVPGVLV